MPSIRDARVILASASPRRSELLQQIGVPFTVDASGASEEPEPGWDPETLARELARRKTREVAARHADADVVIGADTVVVLGDEVLGKPRDAEDACRMLIRLQGQTHRVVTGWCLVVPESGQEIADATVCEVTFDPVDAETIRRYVETGEPLDKAGAYAIQGRAGLFVRSIAGDYPNIVGLPIRAVGRALRQLGWHVI